MSDQLLLKTAFDTRIKSLDDGGNAGQFTALVSVFGNVDAAGDVVQPGAFNRSIGEWRLKGDVLPVVWNHDHSDPFSHIGHVLDATETSEGLVVTGQLDMANPKAEQVHRLLKGRRIKAFSFAYEVKSARPGEKNGRPVNELHDLDLLEVGPVWRGCNPEARLLDAKSADVEPQPHPYEVAAGWLASLGAAPRISPMDLVQWAHRLENPR